MLLWPTSYWREKAIILYFGKMMTQKHTSTEMAMDLFLRMIQVFFLL